LTLGAGPDGPARRWSGTAPAKVNLFLRVLAREDGGYHQIETLFQALELADLVELRLGADPQVAHAGAVRLEVDGEGAGELGPADENLAVLAARAFLREASSARSGPAPTVWIRLEKRIPHGSGLGGGSSDAAAVLRGLGALLPTAVPPERLLALAGDLGADVPFFLSGSPLALGWGRGDRLLPLPALPPREVVLAVPRDGIPTPWAYGELARLRDQAGEGAAPARVLRGLLPSRDGTVTGANQSNRWDAERWEEVAREAENAFHRVVELHRPDVVLLRRALAEAGARPALLCGSGAALFGVFPDMGAADEAARALALGFAGVRFLRTRTVGKPEGPGVRE
jgi:4-diphosphocytidyl-2-C-methyl-D-erythritol kinase